MASETIAGTSELPIAESLTVAQPLPPPNVALPPRVGIALLTLQLRESLREADLAEAEHARLDPDSALAELRARLEPLIAERRRLLDKALEDAREEAAATIAAAHRQASAIVGDESAPVDSPVAAAVTVVPTISQTSAIDVSTPLFPALPPINVVIDAEAFARVFATVLATVLEERATAWPVGTAVSAALPEASKPAPAQRSFWSQARHLDVLLSGLAMVIVLVILFSWLA